jgi:vancomycin resistance protein VanW
MKKLTTSLGIKVFAVLLAVLLAAEAELTDAFWDYPEEPVPVAARAALTPEEESGPLRVLPWDGDAAFLQRRNEAGTPILMGAYRAVLKDPLPGEEYNVHLAASMLAGIIVKPGQTFSQNGMIGPYTEDRGFRIGPTYIGTQLTKTIGGGVCKIASTLYNVSVLSDLKIVERHCHSMPVPYVPYGQDATVSYGSRDFKFRNDTPFPIMMWAQGIDNKLYIAFYGQAAPPEIEWAHDVTNVVKAQAVYKLTPELEPGMERVALEGMDGATVKSIVTARYADGRVVEKPMGSSFYHPMPFVIEKGK